MKENGTNLNNVEKQNIKKTKKKKGGLIVIVIVVVILALTIGGMIWMAISGNDFATIINNIQQTKEESKNDSNNSKESNNDDSNGNNENNTSQDTDGNNDKGMVSGRGADETKYFKLAYSTKGIKNITVGGASFVCNEDDPEITGINKNVASKIEGFIKNHYSEVWKDINDQTNDDEIKEILTNMNEMSIKYPNYSAYDIGFTQSCDDIFLTNKLVTIGLTLEGGLGGVSWGSSTGVSFDLDNG